MSKAKTVEVTLSYPVQLADRVLENITMRRPTMGDILDYPLDDMKLESEMRLIAHICGLKVEELRLLDSEDYGRLQDNLLIFRGLDPARLRSKNSVSAS